MMEGVKNSPARVTKGCANCLFVIGGEMCPDERKRERDNDAFIKGGACNNYRYRGRFSMQKMKEIDTKTENGESRDDNEVNSRLRSLREEHKPKEMKVVMIEE